MRGMIVVLALLLFGGCAKYVETDVSVFHELNPPLAGSSYAIVPFDDQMGSLEFASYASMVASELNRNGMVQAPFVTARYGVYLLYGIESGKQVVSSYPVYGQTGISGTFSTGTIATRGHTSTLTGVTFYTPIYGVVGTEYQTTTRFPAYLHLDIVEISKSGGGKPRKVYEGRAVSYSERGVLAPLMPAMIRSLFKEFPGQSGITRSSRMPLDPRDETPREKALR